MEQVRRVAALETTILLGGETGTGKTRLARLIHELSPRRDLPFLVVNCGALSTTLIESELFGHVKGAFTGADRDHIGKFAEVGRGTLLLDEIDSLPPALQAKLLRAVEERLFEPVGSNSSLPVQARLIAASNRALDQEAAANRFRSDLYYRLNVISFTLPPLRDRRDIDPALRHGIHRRVRRPKRPGGRRDLAGGAAGLAGPRLARQYPRAPQRHRAGQSRCVSAGKSSSRTCPSSSITRKPPAATHRGRSIPAPRSTYVSGAHARAHQG